MTSTGSVERDERLRLFLALLLPDDVVAALDEWGARTLDRGRRVPREQLHITLAFLGSRPESELPGIIDALRTAAATGGRFPLEPVRYRETRSVGMLVLDDSAGGAGALAADLHTRLEALHVYRREARPWLPHITVLRFRERPRLDPSLPDLRPFAPSEAAAFLSRLHPSGVRYEVLESVPLGGMRLAK